ncbi:MAG TPA: 4a-hydroxytetrahydrobiopterin dehydratase [Ktedonobacterales bacterium]|nr:4a-hydroxytetrahydrobiopterin dehydratase [Ktedonobacterales bacterium]
MAKLTAEQIAQDLAGLSGWSSDDGALVKTFTFPTFPAGIAFVDRVAVAAEEMGHHPDISISYTRITMRLSTHDEGGVTEKDLALAKRIEAAAQG